MARAFITNADDPAESVEFSSTLQDITDGTAQATDQPVEKGRDITDHVRQRPDEFSMNIILTNYDDPAALEEIGDGEEVPDTIQERIRILQMWKNDAQLLTVDGHNRQQTDIILLRISERVEKNLGDGIGLQLRMKKIRIAQSVRKQISAPRETRGVNQKGITSAKKKNVPGKDEAESSTNKSAALKLLGL